MTIVKYSTINEVYVIPTQAGESSWYITNITALTLNLSKVDNQIYLFSPQTHAGKNKKNPRSSAESAADFF